ncbi:hypothetical protein [uncultured Ruminococcus sp.]|uniref:hypothetical protein n=1 Tax=uncultured Ruminococcus sp. TaxID=165186 RepID=UPI0025DAE0E4|nr:hypothetical protein [uncultured Ruminococcus sp.]
MADKFSVDDILSEYNDKINNSDPQQDNEENAAESDIYTSDDNVNGSADVAEDLSFGSDDVEEDDEYTPRRAADFDEEAAETEANAERAAQKISSMSRGKVKKTGKQRNVAPVNRPSVKDIKLGLTGKIIPKTEEFDRPMVDNDATFEEKTAALYEHRRKKVESFVLDTSENEDEKSAEGAAVVNGQKEFENFGEAPKILNDILQVKSNLFLRLCVLLFTGIFSLLITVANDFELPLIKTFDRSISPSAFLFTNTILGLIALGVSYTVMTAGIKNMINRKPDCDSIAAIGIFVTVITGIINLFEPESVREGYYHVYISAAIMGLVFNTLGKMMIVQRTEKNFRYVAGEFDRYAVKRVSDENAANFAKGTEADPAVMTAMEKTEFVSDFVKHSYSPDISDEFARKVSPIILIAGAVVALLSFIFDKNASAAVDKIFVALAAFSGVVTMCSSVSLMLAVNVPMNRGANKFLQYSSVMLGYSAVDEYADANSMLVEAEQLFPKDSVDLVNLKLLSANSLEECILMAASLTCQAGSVLKNAFYRILKGKTEMLYPVESYIYEDGLGLSGWIDNKRVLLGTRKLMENHSIDGIPPLTKEQEYGGDNTVLYLSVSGVVSTMFVVRVQPSISVTKWLQELESEGIVAVIRSVDGFLSEEFISDLFGLESGSVKLLPFRFHNEYEKETEYTDKVSSSMLCSGHFTSFAMLMVGAKRIKSAAYFGVAIQMGAIVLAAVISLASMLLGTFSQITPSVVIAYNLMFTAVSLLVLSNKKI